MATLPSFAREVAPVGSIEPPEPLVVAYVTAPSQEKAEALATGLVEGRLAACVNILPGVKSVYRWEGKIEKDDEVLIIIKTRASLQKAVVDWIRSHHPYAVPETIFLPIQAGNPQYLAWVVNETAQDISGGDAPVGDNTGEGKKEEL